MKNTVFQASLMMAFSVFCIMVTNACAKLASDYHSPIEIVFYRGAFCLALLGGWLAFTKRFDLLKTKRPVIHLGRSVVGNISICMVFWSYSLMPMASATTILLTSGVMVTLLSAVILHERVGPWRWGAVSMGLIGCLIATNPSGEEFNAYGTVVSILAMIAASFVAIFLRDMGKTEHPFTTVFYFLLAGVISTGVYMVFRGTMPRMEVMWPLIGVGIAGLGNLFFKTYAFKLAEASVLSPINYTSLIWAVMFGWIFWCQLPTVPVIIGACLVVGSNMVIVWREAFHARAKDTSKVIEG